MYACVRAGVSSKSSPSTTSRVVNPPSGPPLPTSKSSNFIAMQSLLGNLCDTIFLSATLLILQNLQRYLYIFVIFLDSITDSLPF